MTFPILTKSLAKFLKKETKPVMLMFYAPWCGFCKQLKPDYAVAATELKSKYVMAAIDVDRPENTIVRRQYNITGFPTLLYFENGKVKQTYDGENKKDALVAFMMNPSAPPAPKPKEEDWSTDTSSEIVHLTTNGFEPALKDEKSVLVMFYAPWCGHCKRMKPEYEKAAVTMKNSKVSVYLSAEAYPLVGKSCNLSPLLTIHRFREFWLLWTQPKNQQLLKSMV